MTVAGKEGKLCDALSTAIFVMGAECAIEFWRKNGGFDMILLTDTIEIAYDGGRNTVLIENGQICMSQADCPDQTCVKMGWLKSSALPIVCLQHHLVIQYAENSDAVDGIAN